MVPAPLADTGFTVRLHTDETAGHNPCPNCRPQPSTHCDRGRPLRLREGPQGKSDQGRKGDPIPACHLIRWHPMLWQPGRTDSRIRYQWRTGRRSLGEEAAESLIGHFTKWQRSGRPRV